MDLEQEIQSKGLTAPRLTPADIEGVIASEHYFSAADGVLGNFVKPGSPIEDDIAPGSPKCLAMVTICAMVLRNDHRIIGVNEGPVSATNFDAEIGRKLARANALEQIWPLLGYELRSRLES